MPLNNLSSNNKNEYKKYHNKVSLLECYLFNTSTLLKSSNTTL